MKIVIDIHEDTYKYIMGLNDKFTDYQTTILLYLAVKTGTPLPKGQRPKGKWIDMGYKDEWFCSVGKCSNCGKEHILGNNYCPKCGADMRGGEEDADSN